MKNKLCIIVLLLVGLLFPFFSSSQVIEINKKPQRTVPNHASVKDTTMVIPAPDLTNPLFKDYTLATIYLTPDDSLIRHALCRKNFTDQFIAEWSTEHIYPASRIYGFSQDGKYYRAAKIDETNYVFVEKVNKGKMSFYYCRNLPHVYGDVEFITSDPNNRGYKNTMIAVDENRKRYRNDYHYFVTMAPDTSNLIRITNFEEFATEYLNDCPDAYKQAVKFKSHRHLKKIEKIILPVFFVSALAPLIVFRPETPVVYGIVSGTILTYGVYSLLTRHRKPDPTQVLHIVQAYNNCH